MSNNTFKDRLIAAREKAGLTQTELGLLCDMAPTQVSRYESGRAVPRRAAMVRLADALKVTMDWLANGGEPSTPLQLKFHAGAGLAEAEALVIPESLVPWVEGMAQGLGCSIPDAVVEIIRQHQSLRMTAPTGNAAYPVAGMLATAMTDLELRMKNLEAELAEAMEERHKIQAELSDFVQSKK